MEKEQNYGEESRMRDRETLRAKLCGMILVGVLFLVCALPFAGMGYMFYIGYIADKGALQKVSCINKPSEKPHYCECEKDANSGTKVHNP